MTAAQSAAAAGRGFVHAQALPLVVGEAAGVSGFAFQGTNAHVILAPLEASAPALTMLPRGELMTAPALNIKVARGLTESCRCGPSMCLCLHPTAVTV